MSSMEVFFLYVSAAVLFTECFAGITVNMIIVAANIKKWTTLKSWNSCDTVLSFMVISRILQLVSTFLFFSVSLFYPSSFLNLAHVTTVTIFVMLLSSTNLWFATILCVLYCVKITNYSWKWFVLLKTKISTLVPWFLLASIVFSVSTSLPFGWCVLTVKNLTHTSMHNLTFSDVFDSNVHNHFLIVFFGSHPPFMIFCVANFLIIHSLRMHTRRMRSSGSSPNLEAHFRAVKSMSLFLVLHVVNFICKNISFSGGLGDGKVWWFCTSIIGALSPFIHSLYMICSSNELQKLFISWFCSPKISIQE